MSREDVKKFYELINSNDNIGKEIINIEEEIQQKNNKNLNYEYVISQKIIPIAKKNHLNFTTKEFVDYTNEKLATLNDIDLLNVSGGANLTNKAMAGLFSIMSFAAPLAGGLSQSSYAMDPPNVNVETQTEQTTTRVDVETQTEQMDEKAETDVTEESSAHQGSSAESDSTAPTSTISSTDSDMPVASAPNSTLSAAGDNKFKPNFSRIARAWQSHLNKALDTLFADSYEYYNKGYGGLTLERPDEQLAKMAKDIVSKLPRTLKNSSFRSSGHLSADNTKLTIILDDLELGSFSIDPDDNDTIMISINDSKSRPLLIKVDVYAKLIKYNKKVKEARLNKLKEKFAQKIASKKHHESNINFEEILSKCVETAVKDVLSSRINDGDKDSIYGILESGISWVWRWFYNSKIYETEDSIVVIDKLYNGNLAVTVFINTSNGIQTYSKETEPKNEYAENAIKNIKRICNIPKNGSVSYAQFGRLGWTATQQAKHLLETLNKISDLKQVSADTLDGLIDDIKYLENIIHYDGEQNRYYLQGTFKRGYGISQEDAYRISEFYDKARG